mmetsp:Transcript_9166/g.20705  ORF Transcript_9166/g.20705 Transcript_9166/m.20705 type:complete len:393 (+) Transcript_9166:85-1263(+)
MADEINPVRKRHTQGNVGVDEHDTDGNTNGLANDMDKKKHTRTALTQSLFYPILVLVTIGSVVFLYQSLYLFNWRVKKETLIADAPIEIITNAPRIPQATANEKPSSLRQPPRPVATSIMRHACKTQDPPDAEQHRKEMNATKSLMLAFENRKTNGGIAFTCGFDNSFQVPFPPPKTLIAIHQAAAIWCTLELESKRLGRPANLLVWGLGNDSPFWIQSTKGRVVFLENNSGWFGKMKKGNPSLEAYMVDYPSIIERDLNRLDDPEFVTTINDLLPPGIKDDHWDVILADAPAGCGLKDPGRFGAIYTSKKVFDAQGHGHLFVDDFQRKPEQVITDHVVITGCQHNCGEKMAVWNRIHPESGVFIEKMALFSFGDSRDDAAAVRKIDGANDQ